MDLEFAWALFSGAVQEYKSYLIAGALFLAALWLLRVLRDRRLTREGKAREYAATHCAHGVNKFTRSCRKCAREFEQECRQGDVPKNKFLEAVRDARHYQGRPSSVQVQFPVGRVVRFPVEIPDAVITPVLRAIERARSMADKAGTHLVEVTVRFKGYDGTTYARKITLGANERVNA